MEPDDEFEGLKPVWIHWIDPCQHPSDDGWVATQFLDDPDYQDCYTVGWVIKGNEFGITVASTVSPIEGDYDTLSRIEIPNRCIQKIVQCY
jgi:hypothetical protein